MADLKPLSFEEIDAKIQKLDLSKFRHKPPGPAPHGREMRGVMSAAGAGFSDPRATLSRVCLIYTGVRPIIVSIGAFFFLPKKWRQAVEAFVGVMDGICPQA